MENVVGIRLGMREAAGDAKTSAGAIPDKVKNISRTKAVDLKKKDLFKVP